MPPDTPVADLLGLSRGSRAAILRAMQPLLQSHRDAQTLFLDDKGRLTPAAARLFGRLAREAQIARLGFEPDPRLQDYRLGQQHMVRFLAGMLELDEARLTQLQRQLETAR